MQKESLPINELAGLQKFDKFRGRNLLILWNTDQSKNNIPTVKNHPFGNTLKMLKEILISDSSFQSILISLIGYFQNCVKDKSEQIESEQERRQVIVPMSEVMLSMIAMVLQNVIVSIFD